MAASPNVSTPLRVLVCEGNSTSAREAVTILGLSGHIVDICDPAQNVLGGLRFLRDLHDHYKNPFFILAAYNAGEESLLQYRGVPPFPETVRFVAAVTNEFYEWPAATARQPVLARKATTQPKSAIIGKASAGWSEGFVMHFD